MLLPCLRTQYLFRSHGSPPPLPMPCPSSHSSIHPHTHSRHSPLANHPSRPPTPVRLLLLNLYKEYKYRRIELDWIIYLYNSFGNSVKIIAWCGLCFLLGLHTISFQKVSNFYDINLILIIHSTKITYKLYTSLYLYLGSPLKKLWVVIMVPIKKLFCPPSQKNVYSWFNKYSVFSR